MRGGVHILHIMSYEMGGGSYYFAYSSYQRGGVHIFSHICHIVILSYLTYTTYFTYFAYIVSCCYVYLIIPVQDMSYLTMRMTAFNHRRDKMKEHVTKLVMVKLTECETVGGCFPLPSPMINKDAVPHSATLIVLRRTMRIESIPRLCRWRTCPQLR